MKELRRVFESVLEWSKTPTEVVNILAIVAVVIATWKGGQLFSLYGLIIVLVAVVSAIYNDYTQRKKRARHR